MDWIVSFLTVVSMELIARKRWEGWAVGLVCQAFWLWLVVAGQLWGLVPLVTFLIFRYAVALVKWKGEPTCST